MKEYNLSSPELRLYGVPHFYETGKLERVPEEMREKLPHLSFYGRRIAGARVRFKTDSPKLRVKIKAESIEVDIGLSIYQCQSAFVYAGENKTSRYLGHVYPKAYGENEFEAEFNKGEGMEDILIWLPRNPVIEDVSVYIEDDSSICLPTPYKYEKPIVYYGSSITECGCDMVQLGYNSLISRWLDVDFYNLGFSGSCKGDIPIADLIHSIPDKSIFVFDYDHNAPTPEFLEQTHEKFFLYFRSLEPELPVVMMTRPDFYADIEDAKKRRAIIRKTYENALGRGDKNVYFIDGETFFNDETRPISGLDNIHPNALGFYNMAKAVLPTIERILEKKEG